MIRRPAYTTEELAACVALRQHDLLDRMVQAVEKVKERLLRTSQCLQSANIPHAIIGGNAVAAWVATVDPGAVRNTRDVDVLLHREDLDDVIEAMATVGFVKAEVSGIKVFLGGPDSMPSQGIQVIWAGERVKASDAHAAPLTQPSEVIDGIRVVALQSLILMKLIANRRKDQVHISDMIGVGLIDESWLQRVPADLAPRLQAVLDDHDG